MVSLIALGAVERSWAVIWGIPRTNTYPISTTNRATVSRALA